MSSKSALHNLAKADIFHGKSLAVWKHRMNALLHFDGLTYVIESNPISKPTDDAPKEDHDVYEQWVFDNKLARHLLVGFISSDLVRQFEHFNTTKEIYDYAMDKYNETSKSHLMEAFSAYVNSKMPEGSSIRDHIDQMAVRYSNLAALGKEMNEDFQIMYLLMSLPPSWENLS